MIKSSKNIISDRNRYLNNLVINKEDIYYYLVKVFTNYPDRASIMLPSCRFPRAVTLIESFYIFTFSLYCVFDILLLFPRRYSFRTEPLLFLHLCGVTPAPSRKRDILTAYVCGNTVTTTLRKTWNEDYFSHWKLI